MKKINLLLLFVFILFIHKTKAQPANKSVKLPAKTNQVDAWADSVYNKLSLDQKIGQLFMIAAYSGGEKQNRALIEKLIKENGIGGLIFMQGTAEAQAEQTNAFQKMSKVPLLIGMDAEWGLGMRLKDVDDLPRQIMMGAMKDSSLVYKMSQAIAYQCRRMGVHIDFGPDIDINNNPNNPVINFRSFGENKYLVAKFGIQYMKGLQENGIIACAKHFPGHGNTDVDSHKDLPVISSSQAELENLELYPFRELIKNGVGSIMTAHLQVPAIDNRPNTPATLSDKLITNILKTKYGYKGLLITDALNMQGVAKFYAPGDIDVKAFLAGNDVLLFSQDVPSGVSKIKTAINDGRITDERLEESVKKILKAKFIAGLSSPKYINPSNATNDLNKYTSNIRTQIAKEALTLLSDQNNIIDKIKRNSAKRTLYIGVGTSVSNTFAQELQKQGIKDIAFLNANNASSIISKAKNYDAVIIGVHNIALYPGKNFGINTTDVNSIAEINKTNNCLVVVFGNPYAAKYFCNAKGLLIAYDDKPETQNIAAAIVTGRLKAKGKLPVTVCPNYKQGAGIASVVNELGEPDNSNEETKIEVKDVAQVSRIITNGKDMQILPTTVECCINPAVVGADNSKLEKIDELMKAAIAKGAFPGCRVLIAKDGKAFYDKSFGYTSYEKKNAVNENTIYDIASVTKVAATTLAIMKLYDDGKLNLDATLGTYFPTARNTDKANLKIKDILLHQAGLKSWIPFYKETLDSTGYPKTDIYSSNQSNNYSVKVANNLYMKHSYLDTMWKRIWNSPIGAKKYEYSDLDFILLQKVVENITGTSLDAFVNKEFYSPLVLNNTSFLPLKKFKINDIAPTEVDNYFRHQTVQGNVHDMAAAMFGGVSGHAGLFSTAPDLAVILQMLLNNGMYNGKRYLSKKTINLFSAYQGSSRRGLGFDKPDQTPSKASPCADNCSPLTIGHQGFTGTCIWADPQYNILFVFLSNRTFPNAENKLITSMSIRTKAQEYAYEALGIAIRK